MADQQTQMGLLVSQLANERIQREYSEKMHYKEVRELNDQFKLRERHIIKKYKRVKKRFNQSLLIIEQLRRELERYRFDNDENSMIANEQMLLDMSRKSGGSRARTAIPRSQTPILRNADRSKIEFKVPQPRPAYCSSARNAANLDHLPSRSINSSRVLCEHRTPCENHSGSRHRGCAKFLTSPS